MARPMLKPWRVRLPDKLLATLHITFKVYCVSQPRSGLPGRHYSGRIVDLDDTADVMPSWSLRAPPPIPAASTAAHLIRSGGQPKNRLQPISNFKPALFVQFHAAG